jgi:hypothetical protein
MSSYILRSIPPDLWASVKLRATTEATPLRQVILFLLRAYADGEVSLGVTREKTTV